MPGALYARGFVKNRPRAATYCPLWRIEFQRVKEEYFASKGGDVIFRDVRIRSKTQRPIDSRSNVIGRIRLAVFDTFHRSYPPYMYRGNLEMPYNIYKILDRGVAIRVRLLIGRVAKLLISVRLAISLRRKSFVGSAHVLLRD